MQQHAACSFMHAAATNSSLAPAALQVEANSVPQTMAETVRYAAQSVVVQTRPRGCGGTPSNGLWCGRRRRRVGVDLRVHAPPLCPTSPPPRAQPPMQCHRAGLPVHALQHCAGVLHRRNDHAARGECLLVVQCPAACRRCRHCRSAVRTAAARLVRRRRRRRDAPFCLLSRLQVKADERTGNFREQRYPCSTMALHAMGSRRCTGDAPTPSAAAPPPSLAAHRRSILSLSVQRQPDPVHADQPHPSRAQRKHAGGRVGAACQMSWHSWRAAHVALRGCTSTRLPPPPWNGPLLVVPTARLPLSPQCEEAKRRWQRWDGARAGRKDPSV